MSILIKNRGMYLLYLLCITLGLVFIISNPAHADILTSVDDIQTTYQTKSATWEAKLVTHAERLFWILAFIEFAWAAIQLGMRSAGIEEIVATVINQIIFIGFFYWLLTNSATFANAIVSSFTKAAGDASGTAVTKPSDVFNAGMFAVQKIFNSISAWTPVDSLGMLISAIIIIICFALITAFLIYTYIESYVVISASVLLMGFGGSRWTKDYAIRTFQYAVSVGAKLFVMILLIGIGLSFMRDWADQFNAEKNIDLTLMIGCSVVLLALTKTVPDMVQGIINGASVGQNGAITGAAAAVGGAVGAAGGAVIGAGMAAGSAAKLASEQLQDAKTAGTAPSSKMGTAGFMMGSMAKNLGSSLKQDIGSRFSGQNHGHGNMGGRMSGDMSRQAQELKANRQAPQNSPANGNSGNGQNNNPITSLNKPDNTIS